MGAPSVSYPSCSGRKMRTCQWVVTVFAVVFVYSAMFEITMRPSRLDVCPLPPKGVVMRWFVRLGRSGGSFWVQQMAVP
eukprot:scaffold24197_cov51-Attheya_sp.AAC.4